MRKPDDEVRKNWKEDTKVEGHRRDKGQGTEGTVEIIATSVDTELPAGVAPSGAELFDDTCATSVDVELLAGVTASGAERPAFLFRLFFAF